MSDSLDDLSSDSAQALVNWASQDLECSPDAQSPAEKIWALSGVPTLFGALAERISEGVGQETIDKVARSSINLANGLRAGNQVTFSGVSDMTLESMGKDGITIELNEIEARSLDLLRSEFDTLIARFQARIDGSHRSFLERATAALISHLEKNGDNTVWQYDPAGLRVLLRSSYRIFGSRSQRAAQSVFESVAAEICEIYARAFGNSGAEFNIEAPPPPRVPPPVFLGQTIALDLQGSWWKNWWQRRRGYQAFASGFYKMIKEETDPIVSELKAAQVENIRDEAVSILGEFLADQRAILMSVVERTDASPDELKEMLGIHAREDRKKVIETAMDTLNRYVA